MDLSRKSDSSLMKNLRHCLSLLAPEPEIRGPRASHLRFSKSYLIHFYPALHFLLYVDGCWTFSAQIKTFRWILNLHIWKWWPGEKNRQYIWLLSSFHSLYFIVDKSIKMKNFCGQFRFIILFSYQIYIKYVYHKALVERSK